MFNKVLDRVISFNLPSVYIEQLFRFNNLACISSFDKSTHWESTCFHFGYTNELCVFPTVVILILFKHIFIHKKSCQFYQTAVNMLTNRIFTNLNCNYN